MTSSVLQAIVVGAIVYVVMIAEALVSRRHERFLRARGAIEPPDDVYSVMRFAYPLAFAAPLVEGCWRGDGDVAWWLLGSLLFIAGKTVKYWAVTTLGPLWSFRVLVVPGVRMVTRGPYRFMRHPNYLGILLEIAGVAVIMAAPVSGAAALIVFGLILRRRVQVEERALGGAQ